MLFSIVRWCSLFSHWLNHQSNTELTEHPEPSFYDVLFCIPNNRYAVVSNRVTRNDPAIIHPSNLITLGELFQTADQGVRVGITSYIGGKSQERRASLLNTVRDHN